MTTNRWRWRWGNSMARALLVLVALIGQWLGIGGKEAEAQERFVPPGDAVAKAEANLVTNIYQVPPTFLHHDGAASAHANPFASPEQPKALALKLTAKEILERAGTTFGEGASAIYQPSDSQLIVRNTQDQLELVEAYIDSLTGDAPLQVHITATFATSSERLLSDELAIAEPKISGHESAAFVAEDQGAVVDLLTETNLDEAVSQAKNRSIRQAVTMKPEVTPTVLTAMAFTDLLDQLRKRVGQNDGTVKLVEGSGAWVASAGGASLLIQAGDRGVGVASAIVGADFRTLDLAIYSQGPQIEGRDERRVAFTLLTIWDGFTIAIERRLPSGLYEYDFVTARIIDTAGEAINRVETIFTPLAPVLAASDRENLPKVEVVTAAADVVVEGEGLAKLPLEGEKVELPSADFYTNVYQVPPTFLNTGGGGSVRRDPFASPEQHKALAPRLTAQVILERAGVTFGEGASAIYQVANSQLIVRNTLDQMELVEAYVESIKVGPEKQIYVRARFVETSEPLFAVAEAKKNGASGDQSLTMKVDSRQDMARVLAENDFAAAIKARAPIVKSLAAIAVLADPKFQAMVIQGRKHESWKETEASAMFRSGQGATVLATGERGLGVVDVVLGADGFTIDLSLMLQRQTEKKSGVHSLGQTSITIWDGQTLVFAHQPEGGRYRYDFVTATIKDPAGMPLNREEQIRQAIQKQTEQTPDQAPAVDVGEFSDEDKENVKLADTFALRGNQLMAQEQYAESRDLFLKALRVLPQAELTRDRETAYLAQFLSAARAAIKQD